MFEMAIDISSVGDEEKEDLHFTLVEVIHYSIVTKAIPIEMGIAPQFPCRNVKGIVDDFIDDLLTPLSHMTR